MIGKMLTLIFAGILFAGSVAIASNPQQTKEKSKTYPYLAYVPNGYQESIGKEWPLIIYLHGSSCKGKNLDRLKKYGPPFYLDRGMQVDAIVISPQCPSNRNWVYGDWFESFYSEILAKYHVDPSRVYLTGMSLGGFGTWSLASRYPHLFAAIMPLCGGGRPDMAETIKDMPTWVFHGEKDRKVKLTRSTEMVAAMQEQGSRPKFSVLKGEGHDIHHVYAEQSVYEWLLAQHKSVYEKLVILNFWSPKTDSVISKRRQEIIKEVRQSDFASKFIIKNPAEPQTQASKSFFMNLFKSKEYEQSTLK
ncbi:MAG: prolyl oligopeptidase family serine peptidase [Marinilabiliales bacterium]|nr:prolyl oligopeptidase family serine peptidase [Marinilabiliales bacterium]